MSISAKQSVVSRAVIETLEQRALFSFSAVPVGTFDHGNTGSAEIVAFDNTSKRLFVVNAATSSVDIMSVSAAGVPAKLATIDTSAFGSPNSVSAKDGLVAVAVQAPAKTDAGFVLFYNTNGTLLKSVQVGSLPDMLTFTPDGQRVLVANEGEPDIDYAIDPNGSISIIDLRKGIAKLEQKHVTTLDFTAFNSQRDVLIKAGVRIFGPNASVAQDIEPEYITVDADGKTAYVTLQENNAVAVVSIISQKIEKILPLGYKDWSTDGNSMQTYTRQWESMPSLGNTLAGQQINLGGFSGLFFTGYSKKGDLQFVTHTDRGPNAEPTGQSRPFLLPDFQPEIVKIQVKAKTGEIEILERIKLTLSDGTPLTGLPNTSIAGANGNTPYQDEVPVDVQGNPVRYEAFGADLEGIAVDKDGTFWMVDEYRPAIYHFDKTGKLIERLVPIGTAAAAGKPQGYFGTEVLPAVLAQRRQNRGFEGLAIQDGKLLAFVQSPLRNPTSLTNAQLNLNQNIRIVELDLTTKATKQYLYIMDNANLGAGANTRADKLGDAVAISNGQFLVVERDDDAIDSDDALTIEKKVYKFSLAGATDISNLGTFSVLRGGVSVTVTVDQMTAAELAANNVGAIKKSLHVDLNKVGYNTVEKVEGLAFIDSQRIAVINDNDFTVGAVSIDPTTGVFTRTGEAEDIVLGVITVQNRQLDASDRDSAINLKNWPVFGMYQPDTIASYQVDGQTYFVTANEGDVRAWGSYVEDVRVRDVVLDPTAFPNAAALQQNAALGRLKISSAQGDTDGDGDYDQLYTFGARSFSIWDTSGNLVFDSAGLLEQITAAQVPALFNSEGAAATFDTRSDDKGPEPEALTLGQIGGKWYAFVGLERTGGILVFDITNPSAPSFVQYLQNAGDLAPEGLAFVSAANSPTGKPLLATANEASGTTTIYEITVTD